MRSGFTLVEVLVALLIFALIAVAGSLVLSQTIDNRFAVKAHTDRLGDLQRMRALLQADIGQATTRRARGATGRPMQQPMMGPSGPGRPVLTLVRSGWSNPDGQPRASLQRVEYAVVGDRLERRAAARIDGARPGPAQVLYRGVSDVRVSFLSDGVEAPAFGSRTDKPLPDAVRVSMRLEGYGPVDQLFVVGGGG